MGRKHERELVQLAAQRCLRLVDNQFSSLRILKEKLKTSGKSRGFLNDKNEDKFPFTSIV